MVSLAGFSRSILNMERVLDPACHDQVRYINKAVSKEMLTFTVTRIFLAALVLIEPWEFKGVGPIGLQLQAAPSPPVLVAVTPLYGDGVKMQP